MTACALWLFFGALGAAAETGQQHEMIAAFQSRRYSDALSLARLLARRGDPEAQNILGILYSVGKGVPRDSAQALKWYTSAAKGGSVDAQVSLGMLYANGGKGVPQDYARALSWYRMAASADSAAAQNGLGDLYFSGMNASPDYVQAAKWYRLAAEQGWTSAQMALGRMYEEGLGLEKDYAEALKWYEVAAYHGYGRVISAPANRLLSRMTIPQRDEAERRVSSFLKEHQSERPR